MTYNDLKEFCNSLTQEQLTQEVYLSQVDNSAIKIGCGYISEEDQYFEHTDGLGTLEEIKEENPDDWEEIIEEAILCPKGTVMLLDEEPEITDRELSSPVSPDKVTVILNHNAEGELIL